MGSADMVRSLRRMILREFAAIRLDAEGAKGKEGSFQEGRKVPVIPCFGPDEPGPSYFPSQNRVF